MAGLTRGKTAPPRVDPTLPLVRRWMTVAVLLAAALLAPLAALGSRLPILAAGLSLAIGLVYLLWRWPQTSFPLLVPVSLLAPFAISTGAETGVNAALLMAMVMLGVWVVDMVARKREISLAPSPTVVPVLGWMAVCLIAFGFGQLNWLPGGGAPLTAQLGGLALMILLPGMFMLSYNRLRDLRTLQWTIWLFVGLGGIFVAGMVIPGLADWAFSTFQRAVLDAMFWTWLVTICFSQSVCNRELKPVLRAALGAIAVAAFYFLIAVRQGWTSGWLPPLVSVWVILFLTRPRWAVAGLLVTAMAALLRPSAIHGLLLGGDNAYSLQTRLEAWRIVWDIIKLNPIFGVGPANYHAYTPLYRILGFSVNFNSHNNYLDLVAQVGFLGLVFFLWFSAALARVLVGVARAAPLGFARAYALGAFGGLAGMLASGFLGDWFLPFLYNVGLEGFRAAALGWTFLGAAAALGQSIGTAVSPGEGE